MDEIVRSWTWQWWVIGLYVWTSGIASYMVKPGTGLIEWIISFASGWYMFPARFMAKISKM